MKAIIMLGSLSNMIDIKEITPNYQILLPVRKDVLYMNEATGKKMVFNYNRTLDIDGQPVALYLFKEIKDV